jgi:type VI protein secretion system component VasK
MTERFDIKAVGAPSEGQEHHHHRARATASLIAAVAGGLAVLVFAMLAVGGIGPGDGTAAWIALGVLVVIWLTGLWWRWDAPDRRTRKEERERRGF